MSTSLGRLSSAEIGKSVKYDSPEKTMSAVLSNQDAIVAAIKALCAKLDSNHGAASDHQATISNALSLIDLNL